MTYAETSYLSVIPIIISIILSLINMSKMSKTSTSLKGTIRYKQDLALVREAINVSMILAIVYLAVFGIMIVMLAYFVVARGMFIITATTHLFIFGIVTLPVALIGKSFEKKIKSLPVETDDPEIADKYQKFLVQWNEPRLKLPD